MYFKYTAKTKDGRSTTGFIESDSQAAARQQLRSQGVFLLSIEEAASPTAIASRQSLMDRARVSRTDLLMATSQMAIMCKSGVELAEAIQAVGDQATKPKLKKAFVEIHNDITDGEAVSTAMERQMEVFGPTYVASIRAGETAGNIVDVLNRLAELLRNEIRLWSTIRGIMAYPIVLVCISFIVTMAIMLFVLPQFASVFKNMGVPAPPLTQALLSVGDFMRTNWIWLTSGVAVILVSGIKVSKTVFFRRRLDRVSLNGFVFNKASRPILTGRMLRLLGTMLQSGIPLLESLQLCRASIRNVYFHELFDRLEEAVTNGHGVGRTLTETFFIPPGAAQMVSTAERTGQLGDVMNMVGEFYEDEGERRLRDIVKLLEPAIIVVLGIVVGTIVISVVLPLLDFSTIRGRG